MSLLPAMVGLGGVAYVLAATVLGLAFITLAGLFARDRSIVTARRLFLFSLLYLAALWAVLVADRLWG